MKKLFVAGVAVLLAGLTLEAKPARQLTRPPLPRIEALQPLGLKLRWYVYLPVDGARDGVAVAQTIENQFVAQTFSGSVQALDAETGRTQWRVRLDTAYGAQKEEAAHNDRMFFVAANARMHGIERATGNAEWSYDLPGILATGPAADFERLYVCTAQARVFAYMLPLSQVELRAQQGSASLYGQKATDRSLSPSTIRKPESLWQFQLETAVLQPPMVFGTHVVFADGKGTLFSFQKDQRSLADVIKSPSRISAPMTQQGDMLYVASEDHNVYAYEFELGSFKLRWQYPSGSRVLQKPMVIGNDVYVIAETSGLHCLDRETGVRRWSQPSASRYVGATRRLVCAGDRYGRMHVIDRQRGKIVGTLDTGDFALQVQNDVSNRIYLANHDGLVVCLQDIDPAEHEPIYYQSPPRKAEPKPAEPAADAPPKAKKEAKEEKKEMKDKEEMKEKDK